MITTSLLKRGEVNLRIYILDKLCLSILDGMLFLPVSLYVLCYITLYLNSILTMFVSYFYFDN